MAGTESMAEIAVAATEERNRARKDRPYMSAMVYLFLKVMTFSS
jgi:hypothetical protein